MLWISFNWENGEKKKDSIVVLDTLYRTNWPQVEYTSNLLLYFVFVQLLYIVIQALSYLVKDTVRDNKGWLEWDYEINKYRPEIKLDILIMHELYIAMVVQNPIFLPCFCIS